MSPTAALSSCSAPTPASPRTAIVKPQLKKSCRWNQRNRPKQPEKNRAVVLVIDKSGSMRDENRILYAKEAAKAVARQLKDIDLLGVVGFDDSPFVVVYLESMARLRGVIDNQIDRLRPGGQNLLPAGIAGSPAPARTVQCLAQACHPNQRRRDPRQPRRAGGSGRRDENRSARSPSPPWRSATKRMSES